MSRSVSIAEAKDQLSKLVHDAEEGASVELTRRGKPVAVLISHVEYRRLASGGRTFWSRLDSFRAAHHLDTAGLEPDEWLADARQSSDGREFSW